MTDDVTFSELQDDDKLGISEIYGDPTPDPVVLKVNGRAPQNFWHVTDNVIVEGNHLANRISASNLSIFGMGGADVLKSGGGDASAFGGNGNDRLYSLRGNDSLFGGEGRDKLTSSLGDDELYGEAGRDTLIILSGDNLLDGGDGLDVADFRGYGGNVTATMINPGDDPAAVSGNVLVNVEKVFGNDTGNQITGDDQANTIVGGKSEDTLSGNGGNDTINGKHGWDEIDGGDGNDWLRGDLGDDTINGGAGNDRLLGDAGRDELIGGDGNDTLSGGGDADLLQGGDGNDRMNGGLHYDTLEGGRGNDILRGGKHGDRFIFSDDHGHDKIRDFSYRNQWEIIDLSDVTGMDSFDDVKAAARNTFHGVVIETGDDSSIRLDGVRLGHLDADDFIFV